MLVLGLDFETTGLDPRQDQVTEVGLVLWDVELHMPVEIAGFLVMPHQQVPPEVEAVNGVTNNLLERFGWHRDVALDRVHHYMRQAHAVVAFNGTDFDKLFYENWCWPAKTIDQLWIDTRLDVEKPLPGNLMLQAAMCGFVNPFPHRAVCDVLTMMKVLDGHDFEKIVARAKIPNVTVAALGLPFERKHEAKDRGYYWDPAPVKLWKKRMKACDVEQERREAPFRIGVSS